MKRHISQVAAADSIIITGVGGIEVEVRWWNKFGRKKLRRVVSPISKLEILPDNRMVLYPPGWKADGATGGINGKTK